MSNILNCPFCGSDNVSFTPDEEQHDEIETITGFIWCHGCNFSSDSFWSEEKAVEKWNRRDAPTVDAVAVVHGSWCCVRKSPEEWKCSRCSAYMPSRKNWLEPFPNYCSNCGADMRTNESTTHNMPEDMRDRFRESYSGQRFDGRREDGEG